MMAPIAPQRKALVIQPVEQRQLLLMGRSNITGKTIYQNDRQKYWDPDEDVNNMMKDKQPIVYTMSEEKTKV